MLRPDFLPKNTWYFLFTLLGLVYLRGLFVPLMDNDSAHHANIALHMHLTGDFVNLIDYGNDYLDKPHLHFWLAAFSYKLFGVTTFAYKFPSFLFTILGIWSTFRLGQSLYNRETGKLAALILAASFAFILANNDVRMDAILTASVAFATWQLIDLIKTRAFINIAGAALGLALSFATKGHIGVFVPVVSAFLYILYLKEYKLFYNWRWLAVIALFFVFISPVIYCYYLQYNLHPEKIVRGRNNIDGIRFILLDQSVGRFSGEMGSDAKNDYFFFFHSFLWAFAPWSIVAYIAIVKSIRGVRSGKVEWMTAGTFIILALIVSFSGFKLPHYLNIVFPVTAVLTAAFFLHHRENGPWIRRLLIIQGAMAFLLLALTAVINGWAFPVKTISMIIRVVLLLAIVFYFIKSKTYTSIQKTVLIPVAALIFCFALLNSNFYPQLLTYQGGNMLAAASKGKVDYNNVYLWKETYSSSFNFYSATTRKTFHDSVINHSGDTWLLYDIRDEQNIKDSGYNVVQKFINLDYEITKLDLKFVNPKTRDTQCTKMVLGIITKK